MNIADYFVLVFSILMIIVVMLQTSKDDINDAFNGSKTDLFKDQKVRGAELVLQRATIVIAIFFVALVISKIPVCNK